MIEEVPRLANSCVRWEDQPFATFRRASDLKNVMILVGFVLKARQYPGSGFQTSFSVIP